MQGLAVLARAIDSTNEAIGRAVSWLAVAMVVVQFTLVLMRYVFGLASIGMQESLIYMHGLLFMLAAGYTLRHDAHVRVDVFYRDASPRRKAMIDLAGVFLLLLPVCLLIWYVAWPYVAQSWAVRESSKETSGLPGVFLYKTAILVFVALVIAQGLAMAARAILLLMHASPTGPAAADQETAR